MKIEHTAYQVGDAASAAKWYAEHLGMTIKRSMTVAPFAQFVADSGDHVMLEFYTNPSAEIPDYTSLDPIIFHLAFLADDVAGTRARLLSAGATAHGEVTTTAGGDDMCFLRDPWGLPLQLIRRQSPMI